jgi:UDP-N-acetylmuramoylalanine--D-glutamate ligase
LPEDALGLAGLDGERVLIVGTGREATAIATKLLERANHSWIGALDGRPGPAAEAWRARFGTDIPLWIAQGETEVLPAEIRGATIAIMSPGIAHTGWFSQALRALGVRVTSGSALFVADHASDILGVTGSKGKSTTTSLIHHLLVHAGVDAGFGGNMGIPVHSLGDASSYVIEFSSFQCHYLQSSPRVSVLSALFPEHLDWHGSVDAYYGDKLKLVEHSQSIIANGDDETVRVELGRRFPSLPVVWVGQGERWHLEPDGADSWLMRDSTRLIHSKDLGLLGRHNHHNALIALAAASMWTGGEPEVLAQGFAGFTPLPHRLEPIEDPSGVVFVNDSLATNPQAAAAALRALPTRNLALLIGGLDRGVDYQPLVDQIVQSRPQVVLGLPDSGPALLALIGDALEGAGLAGEVLLEAVESMEQAVLRARELIEPGGYVVLSPAAPSFGVYRDYQHRAEDFQHWITTTAKDHL